MISNEEPGLWSDAVREPPVGLSVPIQPLPCDRWLASSALQKAIRRGEVILAQRAARTLCDADRRSLWRRLLVIAFEDVGVGSIEAIGEVASLAASAAMRRHAGGEEAAVLLACRLLAEAPKDRSADLLMTAVMQHPGLEGLREHCQSLSRDGRLDIVADGAKPLTERAVAAWFSCGLGAPGARRVGAGDIAGLMGAYSQLRVPARLIDATEVGARQTRSPLVLLVPLLGFAAAKGATSLLEHPLPPSALHAGAPLYALDMHTRLGREAIRRFGDENAAIARFVRTRAPRIRNDAALRLATFYADSARVGRRLMWAQSQELERFGIAADFHAVGVAAGIGAALITLVGENLAHLDAIRIRTLTRDRFRRGGAA
jgi:MgsA AAA+ ATPase C terminal